MSAKYSESTYATLNAPVWMVLDVDVEEEVLDVEVDEEARRWADGTAAFSPTPSDDHR